MSTQKVKRRVSWNTKEYEEAYFFFLIMLNCTIYNVILLCIIFSSYYSLFTLHRSFYPKCNIMLLFLNRARVDNNSSGRVSNYISFARNCIPYYIFFFYVTYWWIKPTDNVQTTPCLKTRNHRKHSVIWAQQRTSVCTQHWVQGRKSHLMKF